MKRWSVIVAAAFIVAAGLLPRAGNQAAAQSDPGWISLFDGETLANWDRIGTANWRLENGAVVADDGRGFLVSKDAYKDFDLRVEFWIEAKTNSGVFIRCTDPASVSGKTAYEVNIWDTRPEQKYGTGAIVGVAAVDPMPHAAGRWNVYEISVRGNKFFVTLNGQKTVDGAVSDKFAKGHIALQHGKGVTDESGIVKFRKVEIRLL
jgi:type II secretory pathway pseudopilin PulG